MISALLAQFMPYLIAALVFIAGIFGYGIKKKNEGKQEAENKGNKEALDNVAKAREAESEADKIDDVDSELKRNDWMRD